jgi:hypothetical protein
LHHDRIPRTRLFPAACVTRGAQPVNVTTHAARPSQPEPGDSQRDRRDPRLPPAILDASAHVAAAAQHQREPAESPQRRSNRRQLVRLRLAPTVYPSGSSPLAYDNNTTFCSTEGVHAGVRCVIGSLLAALLARRRSPRDNFLHRSEPFKGRFSEAVDPVAGAETAGHDGAMMTTDADITHPITG